MRAETTIYRARAPRRRRQSLVALQRGGLALLAIGAAVGIVGLIFAGSAAKLAGGTTIEAVDVGGLTGAQAVAKLRAKERALERQPVAFRAGGTTSSYSATQLGVQRNWPAAVAIAKRDAGGFWPIRAFRRLRISIFGHEVAPRVTTYPSAVSYAVGQIATRVDTPEADARVVRHGLQFSVEGGHPSLTLDRTGAERLIVATLGSFERPARVDLPVHVTPPKVTAARLRPVARRAALAVSAPVRLVYGSTAWRIPRWRLAQLLDLPEGGATKLAIGGPAAEAWFRGLDKAVARAPVDATFRILAGNRVGIVPSKPGLALDAARTAKAVLAAALAPAGRTAQLAVSVAQPKRTTAVAQKMGVTDLVSSYETTYGGTPGRLHNVALVANLIDDTLIAPGQVFSFNGTTGARTAAKGFEVAPVIINGELTTGLGGGVCQVSTTTFNAAFFAGLPILERTNHALFISHYPLGRDATVDYPSVDLKFRNDTDHWLLLRTSVGTGSLTVSLYGTPTHRRVEYETSPLVTTGPFPVQRVKDPTLKKGEQVVEQDGIAPTATSVRRKVYDEHGKLLYDTTWHSSYVAQTEILRVGTKKPKKKPPIAVPPAGLGGLTATPSQ